MKFFSREKHLQSAGPADKTRQTLGASPSGDEAEGGAAMSEDGMWTGDAVPASEGEIEASTHAIAVDGGKGWGREAGEDIHQTLAHMGEAEGFGAAELGDFVEVGPGGEEMDVAGENEL